MKNKIFMIVMVALSLLMVACQPTNTPPGDETPTDEVAPLINGTKTIYYEIGQPTPNYMSGVSAFDETDGNVSSSIIIDARLVNLSVEGEYQITYYAFDLSGNKAEKTATINVSAPDVVDLTAPNYPVRDYVLPADVATSINLGSEASVITAKPPLFEIEYNEAAAKDMTWETSYNIKLANQNYSRKTKLGMNVLGSGSSIYIKLFTVAGVLVFEREIAATTMWSEVLVNVPDTQRHLLSENLELVIIAPRPTLSGKAGVAKISGIWFEGDAEPSIKLEYDPENFDTIYEVDLSDFSNEHDGFDNLGIAAGGLLTAVYDSETKAVTFTNNGYNDWANMAYRIPSQDLGGNPLALSEVTLIVIEVSVSDGAIVKAQNDWNSGDLFEYSEATDGTKQMWILPVGPNGYQAFAAITFAPSYLRQGTDASTVVLHSIKLVKPVDLDS